MLGLSDLNQDLSNFLTALKPVLHTFNSRLADTPLLWTFPTEDKLQIPGESYRGFTAYYSRYYRL